MENDLVPVQDSTHSVSKLLTILIPVFNGGRYLNSLLGLFSDAYLKTPENFARIEIIVANNESTDDTQAIAESFTARLPVLRPLSLSPHLLTAEENIFRSFAHCNGDYTWALGVDDIPNFAVFGRLIEILETSAADFYLFNFALVSENMLLTRPSMFRLAQEETPISLLDLTQRSGFWGTIAGISGQIMRTSRVKNYDFPVLIATVGKIYSHVTAYLECFRSGRTLVINLTLVFYKTTPSNPKNLKHWQNVADAQGVFDEYFWTLGYIRQLEYLEKNQITDDDYLRYMLEVSDTGFFRPVMVMADRLTSQVRLMSSAHDKRNSLSSSDFAEICDYLIRKEPFLREYLWALKSIHGKLLEGQKVPRSEWDDLLHDKHIFSDYLLASLLQGTESDYEIYRVAKRFYGVYYDSRDILLDRLRYLDNEEAPPEIFTGASITEVRHKIIAFGQKQEQILRVSYGNAASRHLADSDHKLKKLQSELIQTKFQLQVARQDYETMLHSASWRITKPLRRLLEIIKRLVNRRRLKDSFS